MDDLALRIEHRFAALLDWAAASPWRAALVITLVWAAVALPGLTEMPVTDRDEARFAQASKQMQETGDLIDIRFQDQPRWKKPVGIYWLQAASAKAFGGGVDAPIWAYRVPSAVSALLAALLTVWAARPLIGARGAVLSGLMMATTLLMVVEGHIAKTDAALTATGVVVLGGLAHAHAGTAGRGTALVFWLGVSAAMLLKGPIVPTIALLAGLSLWLIGGVRLPLRALYPVPGLVLTALLVTPWLIAIWQISGGAFFEEALGKDLGAKLTSGQEKHWGPPGLYLGLVWATFWPWAALIPLALAWLWAQRREAWLLLLAGWAIPFWIVLEVVPTKLPHYVLPLYPALVIALAGWIVSGAARPVARWPITVSMVLMALPALVLTLGLVGVMTWLSVIGIDPERFGDALIASGFSVLGLGLALLALGAAYLAVSAIRQGHTLGVVPCAMVAAGLAYASALHATLPTLRVGFPSVEMARIYDQYRACASGPGHSVGYHEPSLVFLTETGISSGKPDAAVEALRVDPGTMVFIEDRWRKSLGDKLPEGVTRERIAYFNYNRGKMAVADLLTSDDPRWEACATPGG